MRSNPILLNIVMIFSLFIIAIALTTSPRSLAAEQSSDVPAWLTAHLGEGQGQIAQPVLQRARALYLQKLSEGAVRNPCYFAMDATRPNDPSGAGFTPKNTPQFRAKAHVTPSMLINRRSGPRTAAVER